MTFRAVPSVVATTWTLFLPEGERIDIVQDTPSPDESWAVRWHLSCWTRSGEWISEPLRSHRSAEFLAETRWYSLDDALQEGRKAAEAKLSQWAATEAARRK